MTDSVELNWLLMFYMKLTPGPHGIVLLAIISDLNLIEMEANFKEYISIKKN